MAQRVVFTDERVREIKLSLLRGSDPVSLARLERCSASTIRRIRDGETYNHVVVEGEDAMRKPLRIVEYDPKSVKTVEEARAVIVPQVSEEKYRAMEADVLGHVKEMEFKKALKDANDPVMAQAKRMLGLD